MNILPLIMALALMLSVLTIEKLEKFKNQTVVQHAYQAFLQNSERQVFNKRQKSFFNIYEKTLSQLSFRFFIDKTARARDLDVTQQYQLVTIEFLKIAYGEAAFYKNLEKKRPHFIEEMLHAIEQAADAAPEKMIKRIEDIARLNLEDSELQQAFYHMLKGTVTKKELEEQKDPPLAIKEKSYVSLFTFVNYHGAKKTPRIVIQRAPREILKALFMNDEVVEEIIIKRNEFAANKEKGKDTAAEMSFKSEFYPKLRPGLNEKILDFSISKGNKNDYD